MKTNGGGNLFLGPLIPGTCERKLMQSSCITVGESDKKNGVFARGKMTTFF